MDISTIDQSRSAHEQELVEKIDRWLAHMTWRPNFAQWRADRIWQERVQADRLAQIERYGGKVEARRVLDLGSGMGGLSVALALAGAFPLAYEYNPAYCEITKLRAARYDLDLPVINGVGEALPFADESFELVTCWDVLEHVQDPERLISEIARVLRPGGRVLITAINRFAWRDPHYHMPLLNWLPRAVAERIIESLGRGKGDTAFTDRQRLSEMHYYTLPAFRRLAARHGFRVGDVGEDRVRHGVGTATGFKGRVRDTLRQADLALPAYYVYRSLVMGTFELVMVKE